MALAASLLAACATGEEQDPNAPWDDEPIADAGELVEDTGSPPEDTGGPAPDAGYPEDTGSPSVDVPVARDAPAVDVPSPRDVPSIDVPSPVDVPTARDVPSPIDVPVTLADVPVARDVPPLPDVPPTCTGPTTQTCSTCGTQSRTCVSGTWSAWGTCALPALSVAGNWRFGIAPPGSTTTTLGLGWFAAGSSATAFTGAMVDAFGYAELTVGTVDVCTRRITFTKHYLYGSSADASFRYTGTFTAGTPASVAGTWVDVAAATNNSTFTAQSRTGRTTASFNGSWRLTSTFSITSTSFTITAAGGLTGTMVDTYGTAALNGAVDLNSGTVMFIKRYTSGSSLGQQYLYTATVNAAGTAITGGTWSYQGTPTNEGTWSATR